MRLRHRQWLKQFTQCGQCSAPEEHCITDCQKAMTEGAAQITMPSAMEAFFTTTTMPLRM
jgi:hypothetical protein